MLAKLGLAPPYHAGEPPTAYASRLARAHDLLVGELCGDYGLPHWRLVNGEDGAIAKIAELGGVDPAKMKASAFVRTGDHDFDHRGQRLRRESLVVGRLDVCPRCLLDDAKDAGKGWVDTFQYCRAEWLVDAVDTCRIHRCAMVTLRKARGTAYGFDFSDLVAAEAERLGELADEVAERDPTGLQEYVLARLDVRDTGAPVLDDMPLFAAIRSCEMLGAAACFGRKASRDTLDRAQLRTARQRGFEIASRGREAIHELLHGMAMAHARRRTTVRDQVVRQSFSALYDHLHVNPKRSNWKGEGFAVLRTVVSDFIKATFPLKPGDNVLGEIITERKLHSVTSLGKQIGVGPARVKKVLMLAGLIGEDQAKLANPNIVFDAAKGKELLLEDIAAIPRRDAARHLGIGIHQMKSLIAAKLVQPVATGEKLREVFSVAALDAFVASLLKDARGATRKSPDHVSLYQASRRAVCSQADVARLVVDGRLKWVGVAGRKRDFRSVRVNLREVRLLIHGPDTGTIAVSEFARLLGLRKQTAHGLVNHGYVKSIPIVRAGHSVARVPLEEVAAFRRRYVSLGELARIQGKRAPTVKAALDAKGVRPALHRREVFTIFYRRADVR